MKPAGGKQAASNRHGVIYSKGNDRKSWFGCSFRFGRTVLLEVSDPEERVSATVKPEFIRLRMTVVPEGNESGCEKTTIRVNSTSTRSGRKRQLFYQNCKRTEGDRKYKSQPLGILLQRGPAAASTARSQCRQPVGSRLVKRNANGVVWTILDGNRYTGRRSWYGCSYSYGKTVRFHFPAYTSSLTNSPVDKELGVTISDRRSVRKISRWTVQLYDWEVLEGCNVSQTDPATYRASLVTGKGKEVEAGYTCDDEEY